MNKRPLPRLLATALLAATFVSHGALAAEGAEPRAKNVIVFLADAAGVSTLHAASLHGHGAPLQLHIQTWPHLGLSETSPVDKWVSDSANGMSSIMTGVQTRNGVISQGPDAVRGSRDGAPTKTILEYAEERGLRTGVISTQSIADATPAATYAHSNDRKKWGEIFPQAFSPRYGDGVDVLMGTGRQKIGEQLAEAGTSFDALGRRHDRPIHASLAEVVDSDARPVVVTDGLDVHEATLKALDILQDSPEGYFLMVEWDAHTDDVRKGLQNIVDFDRLIAEVQKRVDLEDTLLLFTADHSFGLQVDGGERGEPLLQGYEQWKQAVDASGTKDDLVRLDNVLVNRTHTAEEVVALGIGAGAHRVRGYFPSTHLFQVMLDAWGWTAD
ncbi:alkaline phosphatase [Luteimonas terricola]|uniref:Alkaline phosphatase n=1 Tax=Luteimonas terricola TaxID=645597 RepID=A0ABQ2ELC8_9GAMM|nr:alkaline phosphatase [Luteimonas terricola]GGK16190.1 alkaline phosphatase [Luteimonas terricola]